MRLTRIAALFLTIILPGVAFATHIPGSGEKVEYDGSLSPGTATTGTIGWAAPIDGYDWYCFDVTAGQKVTLTATRTTGDIVPNLGAMSGISEDGTQSGLTVLAESSNSTATSVTLEFTPTAAGPVTIWVSTFLNEDQGDYTVTMTGGTARSSCTSTVETPTPTIAQISVSVPPGDMVIGNDQTLTVPLTVFTASGFNSDVNLNVSGVPKDIAIKLVPNFFRAPGNGESVLTLQIGAQTRPARYTIALIATGGGQRGGITFPLVILCDPPTILGVDQLRSTTFARGSSATLEIKPNGSGPLTYQWYTGPRGSVNFPVEGATSSKLVTNTEGMYWVRVSNACGNIDSAAAIVTQQ